MYARQNALASYGRVANSETDPLRQIVLLYDGAVKFIRLAADDIQRGDLTAKAAHSNRALDIVGYLQSILDFERGGEVAPVLDQLYSHVTMQILRASAALDADDMRRAAEALRQVRDSWQTAATTASAPLNATVPSSPAPLAAKHTPFAVAL